MYWTYLRRELSGRKKQTAIVAAGFAIAIALVIVVNSLSTGVRNAQATALQSVYGVGTDLTVSGAQSAPEERGARGQFEFGGDDGETADGTTTLSQSRLTTDMQRATLDATAVNAVSELDGVSGAAGALSLTNITFDGEIPGMSQNDSGTSNGAPGDAAEGGASGPGGDGGSAFNVDSFTVLGIESADTAVGPLSAVSVSEGRLLEGSDAGENVALLDATYAATSELAVGDTIEVGGTDMEIVGLVTSTSDEADTAANVYIPIDVAQSLAGVDDVVSTIYVQADSSDSIGTVQSEIEAELPDATVSSQSDLASTVSRSLSSASSLITNLGTWLSVILLIVAAALAVLFTISGVSRRTREFGTLKAIGWSNRRVVGQVTGESVIQGLIGGVVGLAIGLLAIFAVNIISPTISTASTLDAGGIGGGPGGGGDMPGMVAASTPSDIVLSAPLSISMILIAIGLAVAGGLVAGAFGGWRASRLSPAEALRSVG